MDDTVAAGVFLRCTSNSFCTKVQIALLLVGAGAACESLGVHGLTFGAIAEALLFGLELAIGVL